MSFLMDNNRDIITDGSDQPVDCATCSEQCGTIPCCLNGDLPATVGCSVLINDSFDDPTALTKVGNSYQLHEVMCDFGDGHRVMWLDVLFTCTSTTWTFVLSQSVYVDGVLQNFNEWSYGYTFGVDYTTDPDHYFYVRCNPFGMKFKDLNTSGAVPLGSPLNCSGFDHPFSATPGTIPLEVIIGNPFSAP